MLKTVHSESSSLLGTEPDLGGSGVMETSRRDAFLAIGEAILSRTVSADSETFVQNNTQSSGQ